MNKQEMDRRIKEAEQQIQQAQDVLNKLNQQKQQALSALEKRVDSLLEDTKKLTAPSLAGEEGPRTTANVLRELISAANSTLLIVDSQNRLIDMLVNDLGATVEKLGSIGQGFMYTSMTSEVMLRTLLDKGVFSEEELKAAQQKIIASRPPHPEDVSAEKV